MEDIQQGVWTGGGVVWKRHDWSRSRLSPLGGMLAKISKGVLLAGQMLTSGTASAGTMFLQDILDGCVDSSRQEYLANFGISAATAEIGFGIGAGAAWIGQNSKLATGLPAHAGKYAPAFIIGAETLIDAATDWVLSCIFGYDYDVSMFVLSSLVSNIAFSIDPVNMATGGFCLTAADIVLPDLMDNFFRLQRIYNSVIPCAGDLGKNWMLRLESRLFIRKEEGRIDAVCMDGHAERFAMEDGQWKNCRQGDSRYQLKESDQEEGFVLLYIPEGKCYVKGL